jgi:hypothetical protein
LGWNTVTGDDQALFPGDASATKLWDVAFATGSGFLTVVAVVCVVAFIVWKSAMKPGNRIVLLAAAVLGTSFLYNLVEAFRAART